MEHLTDQDSAVGITISAGQLRYNDKRLATLDGVDMDIPARQWTCVLGRSGCGKTSLLRYLAGLLDHKVQWAGEVKTQPSHCDLRNQVAYMAQQDLLMPWLSVIDNVTLSAKFGKRPQSICRQRALELLDKVGLADSVDCLPQQLSGGMRQRVALARTLMQNKPVVLMDEPFFALDAVMRLKLQDLAWQLLKNKTVILITHDPQEAIRLANRLYIIKGSPACAQLLQVPTSLPPRELDIECNLLQRSIIENLEQDFD